MREEMENKLNAILKEIKCNKSPSTVTNPRSDINDIHNIQPSGSKTNKSIGVHASCDENSDTENEVYPLQDSQKNDLRHPAKPFYRSETNLDETLESEKNSEEEEYHRCDS